MRIAFKEIFPKEQKILEKLCHLNTKFGLLFNRLTQNVSIIESIFIIIFVFSQIGSSEASLSDDEVFEKPHHNLRPELKFYQSCISGCVAGVADVVVNHPLWAIKIMMQNKEPLDFRAKSLYRGLISNTLTMIPLTTSRVAISSTLQQRSHTSYEKDSPVKLLLSSFFGGSVPAVFGGPTELLRNLEHKYSLSFWDTYKKYVSKKGYFALFRGTPGVAIRDGIYTTSFATLTPLGRVYLEEKYNMDPIEASILSSIASGLFAAVFSHPFDTIKVIQQARSLNQDLSMLKTLKVCYQEEGESYIKAFQRIYRGILPRGIRTVSGVVVISSITSIINELFHENNKEYSNVQSK